MRSESVGGSMSDEEIPVVEAVPVAEEEAVAPKKQKLAPGVKKVMGLKTRLAAVETKKSKVEGWISRAETEALAKPLPPQRQSDLLCHAECVLDLCVICSRSTERLKSTSTATGA